MFPPLVMTSLLEQAPDWLTRREYPPKFRFFNSRESRKKNAQFAPFAPQDCLWRLCIDLTCKSFARFASFASFASGVNAPTEGHYWKGGGCSKSAFLQKCCVSFGNQGLEEEWRGTESKLLEVQCEVSEVRDDLGCRDVCWCWSIVFYQVQIQCSSLPGYFGEL